MKHIRYLLALAVFNLILVGCSSSNKQAIDNLPNEIYKTAQKKLSNRSWKEAIKQLELMDNLYPFSTYSKQVQLDLIYAYYQSSDLLKAQDTINRFIRLNPNYPNIDYIMYMSGLISMALDDNTIQNFFGIDHSDCDPKHARDAFNNLLKLVQKYPNSQYTADANKRLVFLKNRLAKYEHHVASYYTSIGAWIAVVNRVEGMLRDYPDTQATRECLNLMENAYRQMQMNIQAEKVAKIITANNSNNT